MTNVVSINIGRYITDETIRKINEALTGNKGDNKIYFHGDSLLNCTLDIIVDSPKQVISKPSKFKKDASSQYYCVYKKGNGWTYKFVNKGLSKKAFYGALYKTELDAAYAYDKHRYSVEGDLSKLNFPEYFEGV